MEIGTDEDKSHQQRQRLRGDLNQLESLGLNVGLTSQLSGFGRLKKFYESPKVKFTWSLISYLIFLVVFAYHLLHPLPYFTRDQFHATEIILFLFWANFFCQEVKSKR